MLLQEARQLFGQALATGADAAHLVWRALRPELIEGRVIARDVYVPPTGRAEPYSPPPPPEHPPRSRPLVGQQLLDLEQALLFAEELRPPMTPEQLELLTDLALRFQKLQLRLTRGGLE